MLSLALCLILNPPNAFQTGLLEDARILKQAFTSLHPGLYRYNSPASFENSYRTLVHDWNQAQTLPQAYLGLSRFTASIRCGHTYPNFFNQSKSVTANVFGGNNRVPFYFRWLGNRMVVIRDFTPNHTLPIGTEIIAIDGHKTAEIQERLWPLIRTDGHNQDKRRSLLDVRGDDTYEAFDIYYPLCYMVDPEKMRLKVRRPGRHAELVKVKPVSMEERKEESKVVEGWSLRLIQPGVGYWRMPSWEFYDGKVDWQKALADGFRRLVKERAKTLILDLRGDEGGSAVGEEIMGYLVSKSTPYDGYERYVRYKSVPKALRPFCDTWDPSFSDWSAWCSPAAYVPLAKNTLYRMNRWQVEPVKPKPILFTGRLMVLVDSSNSSATFQFDFAVRKHHLGLLIGEPTGGDQRGIDGSAFYFFRLPNSHLEVDIPLVGAFAKPGTPDGGLRPDVLVTPTISDIAHGRDPVLTRALRLARRGA